MEHGKIKQNNEAVTKTVSSNNILLKARKTLHQVESGDFCPTVQHLQTGLVIKLLAGGASFIHTCIASKKILKQFQITRYALVKEKSCPTICLKTYQRVGV